MVTKEGSVEFMPHEWRVKIRKLAEDHVGWDKEVPAGTEKLAIATLTSDIETLVDQCVTEAVLTLMAEVLHDTNKSFEQPDFLERAKESRQ